MEGKVGFASSLFLLFSSALSSSKGITLVVESLSALQPVRFGWVRFGWAGLDWSWLGSSLPSGKLGRVEVLDLPGQPGLRTSSGLTANRNNRTMKIFTPLESMQVSCTYHSRTTRQHHNYGSSCLALTWHCCPRKEGGRGPIAIQSSRKERSLREWMFESTIQQA